MGAAHKPHDAMTGPARQAGEQAGAGRTSSCLKKGMPFQASGSISFSGSTGIELTYMSA